MGPVSNVWSDLRVLHLEGESFAGLSALYILKALMDRVREMEQDIFQPPAASSEYSPLFQALNSPAKSNSQGDSLAPKKSPYRPCHYFDFISGTSLGGSCAIMLGVMRFTVDEAIDRSERLLMDLKPKIPRVPLSSTTMIWKLKKSKNPKLCLRSDLENAISAFSGNSDDKYGESSNNIQSITMSLDKDVCQTLVLTTREERKGLQRPFVFRSYQRSYLPEEADTTGISLLDALRASLSAPSYFDSVKINGLEGSFRDASVTILNPAFEAYHEVRESSDSRIKSLLCFGVSSSPVLNDRAKSPERRRASDRDASVTNEAKRQRFHYHRFADIDLPDLPMDDPEASIRKTKLRASEFCSDDSSAELLKEWAQRLVEYRRQRAETARWNRYAGLSTATQHLSNT